MRFLHRALLLLAAAVVSSLACAAVTTEFPLVHGGRAAPLVVAAGDHTVVRLAVADLAADIARVTGVAPAITPASIGPRVLIGTLGQSPAIDALVAAGHLDVAALRGAWESFLLATVEDALVVVGSDRRGTAFGIYELSQQIGVSPWHWWADVAPVKKTDLLIPAGTRRFGPPSVKYRGLFLNDEDWGLQPWAATTFEPEHRGIGAKTYAKVLELLLRLKANTLWPAMHACTAPFHADPHHAALADDYGIVLGSSHAEPMLRNNVREWTAPHSDYNYVRNRAGVLDYWEARVRANARYENIYTLGMRGIHDSGIQGATSDTDRIRILETVFADQRVLLARHVAPAAESVPQIFCAYKEVLDLYRQGLRVPDDVTLVWPDDNFGYVRQHATPAERGRVGGFGVYYHLSYLGRPLAYLWLSTTPPALMWSELTRAYAHGADRLWIANVGDLKPAEPGTEFFLRLAWDVHQWGPDAQPAFLREWAAREFGPAHAADVAAVMGDFYRLNFSRKPEHLQWWLSKDTPRPSDLTDGAIAARIAAFAELRARTDRLASVLPAGKQDAFFQLVGYPVHGSALANERYFHGELGHTDTARAADTALVTLTRRFNEEIAGGKWRGFMRLEPADQDWKSMRLAPWTPPPFSRPLNDARAATDLSLIAGDFAACRGAAVVVVGLGRTGRAVALHPGDQLDYLVSFSVAGTWTVTLRLLPTHPLDGRALRLAVSLDDEPAVPVALTVVDGDPAWARGVLSGARTITATLPVFSAGAHCLRVHGLDAGVILDEIVATAPAPSAGAAVPALP